MIMPADRQMAMKLIAEACARQSCDYIGRFLISSYGRPNRVSNGILLDFGMSLPPHAGIRDEKCVSIGPEEHQSTRADGFLCS